MALSRPEYDRAAPTSSRDVRHSLDHNRRRRDTEDHQRNRDPDRSPDRRKRHRDDKEHHSRRGHSPRSHRHDHRRSPSERQHRHRDKDTDHASSSHSRRDRDRDHHHHRSHHSSKRRETSQERRARKAAKRAEKLHQLEQEALLDDDDDDSAAQRTAVAELMMYSAQDNPFNDSNLGQKFKWGKKQDKERKQGLTREEAEKRDAQRRQQAMLEIEKLNAKRAEREKMAALRQEEEARMARLAESAQMASWVAKEHDFHLKQAQRRAVIRVKENRAKPIDLLSINLKWADPNIIAEQENKQDDDHDDDDEAGLEIDLDEPYAIFENLTLQETEELHQDVQMYLELEKNDAHLDFWRSMLIVCDDKLEELKEDQDQADGTRTAAIVRQDPEQRGRINAMLSSKSTDELQELQHQVKAKLASGEPVDVEYWERVLKSIVVWRAKARLRDMHEAVLSNRLEYLCRKQRHEAARQQQELVAQTGQDSQDEADALDQVAGSATELDAEEAALEALYDPDEMEPFRMDVSKLSYDDRRLAIKTVNENLRDIVDARRRVTGQAFIPKARTNAMGGGEAGSDDPAERMFMAEASKALDVSEELLRSDAPLAQTSYGWEDKYRPRKPRYFNRVHTGFDWNKYNQTHYDSDNPPPKTVQGYKFNIFYPDLIDKTVAPTYKVIKDEGAEGETVLLRFSAGPPYEDVAFRIVNREWEYSHKRGFRNSFDRGVLQLHFNFKRLRYRK